MTEETVSDAADEEDGRQKKKSDRTRDALYHAAFDQIREKGFSDTSIRSICAEVGVSPATFYTYFDEKGDILREAFQKGDIFLDEYKGLSPMQESADPVERIRIVARDYATMNILTGIDMLKSVYDPAAKRLFMEHPLQDALREAVQAAQEQGLVRDDIDARALAFGILSSIRGVTYTWCLEDGGFDLMDETLANVERLLTGLQTHRAP